MALDARTRSSIYDKLRPILGDDDANALMSEFPAAEHDELVTKEFLRAELHGARSELRQEIASLRTELHVEIAGLRTEMHEGLGQLRTEMHEGLGQLRTEMHEGLGQLRTEMHECNNALAAELRADLVSKEHLDSRLAELRTEIASANTLVMDRLRQQTVFIVTALLTAVGASVGIVQALG